MSHKIRLIFCLKEVFNLYISCYHFLYTMHLIYEDYYIVVKEKKHSQMVETKNWQAMQYHSLLQINYSLFFSYFYKYFRWKNIKRPKLWLLSPYVFSFYNPSTSSLNSQIQEADQRKHCLSFFYIGNTVCQCKTI